MTFLTILYLGVASFALLMTFSEGFAKPGYNARKAVLSFVACAFWPLTVAAIIVMAMAPTSLAMRPKARAAVPSSI
ncbi:hypothetical protein [Pseudoroseicyclus tamaricis]|uniref:Uncharacterized protein n=1 Tax=Pseudoroseicyclus tamaricis TaxID=2705421 RepID=A0A6B2JFG8_9RHOB|nr:hypothetical protein [Pseudoroseicyclus tamaricis]NDU99762.1 hypothetical protein [Pseudoroseicyclus tamaricis]